MPSCTPGINYATVNHLAAKSEKAGGIKLATTSGFQAPVLVRSEVLVEGDPEKRKVES